MLRGAGARAPGKMTLKNRGCKKKLIVNAGLETLRCLASLAKFGILSSTIDSVECGRGARVPRTAFNHPPDQPSIAIDGRWSDGSFARVMIGFDADPIGVRSPGPARIAPRSIGRASARAPSAKVRGARWLPRTDGASFRLGIGFWSEGLVIRLLRSSGCGPVGWTSI